MQKNVRLLYLQTISKNVTSFVITGGVLQMFLLEFGAEETQVSTAVSLFQVSQVLAIICLAGWMDRAKSPLRLDQKLLLLMLPLLGVMGVVSVADIPPGTAFPLLLIAGIITYGGVGLTGSLAYKIPYVLIDMKDYGHIAGTQGAVSSLMCMGLAALLPFLLNRFPYAQIAPFLPLAGILALVFSWFTFGAMQEVNKPLRIGGGKIALFKYKPFLQTIYPNFARGFGYGLLSFMTTIGYHAGVLDSVTGSYIVFLTYATTMLGSFLYSRLAKKQFHDGKILVVCGIILAVLMPFMFASGNLIWLLSIYSVCQVARSIMDVATPAAMVKIIDYDAVLQCAAWRLALFTAASSLAVAVAVPLIDTIGYALTFCIGGLMSLSSGIVYYLLTKKTKEQT